MLLADQRQWERDHPEEAKSRAEVNVNVINWDEVVKHLVAPQVSMGPEISIVGQEVTDVP